MTSIEAHIGNVRDLVEDIQEKMRAGIAVKRQKLISFAYSEASCDLLAILLHKESLIDPGFNVNHMFFSSDKIAGQKFSFEFPCKDRLISLLVKQEEYRNILCYEKPKEESSVDSSIENFFKIKKIIELETGEEI